MQSWEGHGKVPYSSPQDVRQTLVSQCPNIALLEVHRAASKCENIHEDHDKYTAVMPTATPLCRWVFGYTTSATINAGSSDFTVDYLVNSLGFSKEEAIVASSKVTPLKSPENPNSVVNLLKTNGFNETQIKKVVFSMPRILSSDVDKTLKPKLKAFQDLGLYGSDLADIMTVHPHVFLRGLNRHILPTFELLKSMYEDTYILLEALKKYSWMLGPTVPKALPLNIDLLKSYGLSMDQIKRVFLRESRYFFMDPKWFQAVVKRVEEKLRIPRHSSMFLHGVFSLCRMSEERLESKFKVFRSFGWSESDILTLARRNPRTLGLSESKLRSSLNFFMNDLGHQPAEIVLHVCLLTVSLEKRAIPRNAVLEVLKEKRLIKPNYRISSCLVMTEQRFVDRFVLPFKDEVLDLYSDYMRRAGSALETAK
ncbi:hypothetical protein Cgig2_004085 [Carnegiea gigantea]|uniref:Uncharacterized protein n=1 Tax=Carnegiea gigantea TaxID=171969 RepID=A0A9Q1KSH2_9CARY|nr:hypothetical protein Cgig2_004085 [Carnegiea gigantea]